MYDVIRLSGSADIMKSSSDSSGTTLSNQSTSSADDIKTVISNNNMMSSTGTCVFQMSENIFSMPITYNNPLKVCFLNGFLKIMVHKINHLSLFVQI